MKISLSSSALKIIAIITMVIDHVGALFFPEQLFWRMVGRIAFPIFTFLIAEGERRTQSVSRYLGRLLIFAVISQLPFALFNWAIEADPKLNIFFTLAAGLVAVVVVKELRLWLAVPVAIFLCLLADWFAFDYGAFGVLMVLVSSVILSRYRKIGVVLLFVLPTLHTVFNLYQKDLVSIYLFGTMSIPLLLVYNGQNGQSLSRRLLYWFYPGHLLLLWFVWWVM